MKRKSYNPIIYTEVMNYDFYNVPLILLKIKQNITS